MTPKRLAARDRSASASIVESIRNERIHFGVFRIVEADLRQPGVVEHGGLKLDLPALGDHVARAVLCATVRCPAG